MQSDSSNIDDQMMSDDSEAQASLQNTNPGSQTESTNAHIGNQKGLARSEDSGTSRAVSAPTKDSLDELWSKIEKEFKNKQNSGGEVSLPWGDKFKEIFKSEQGSNSEWGSTKQEWKNCKIEVGNRSKQHVEAYCGYLEFKSEKNEYKAQVSYTWAPKTQKNKWDVKVVKKNGGKTQGYNSNTKSWQDTGKDWDKHFNGEKGRSYNAWMSLGYSSVEE